VTRRYAEKKKKEKKGGHSAREMYSALPRKKPVLFLRRVLDPDLWE